MLPWQLSEIKRIFNIEFISVNVSFYLIRFVVFWFEV